MLPEIRTLTYDQIQSSVELQDWLSTFGDHRTAAIEMLMHLRIVTRDTYSEWLKRALENGGAETSSLFAVRKLVDDNVCVWKDDGSVSMRPAASQGSEDLVLSVIANLRKSDKDRFLDHPSIQEMRDAKVREIVLIDDSIGSGQRVREYTQAMMADKHFLSWWSYGLVRFRVIAFSRMTDAETVILQGLLGSNHGIRKYPSATKLKFESHFVFKNDEPQHRWGKHYQHVLDLCDSCMRVPRLYQRGWGGTMASLAFYHSVPDNIPGVFWYESPETKPLFPNRSIPSWFTDLLDGRMPGASAKEVGPVFSDEAIALLLETRRGVRDQKALSWRLGLDMVVLKSLIESLRSNGLLTNRNRVTDAGLRFLSKRQSEGGQTERKQALYVPTSWCADQATVQPFDLERNRVPSQTESEFGSPNSDGKVGQIFLE